VQARAFVRSHDNLAAGHAFGFGDLGENRLAPFDRFLGILEK
jgi:hypothetical protein